MIPDMAATNSSKHTMVDNALGNPFFSNFFESGINSMASNAAIENGAKNGFAKYKPAKTRKKKKSILIAVFRLKEIMCQGFNIDSPIKFKNHV